ncbi:hypothetical protein THTE_1760 [Thermogutta terrifontis]|uniref:Uncharacterized protein n=1 Tax=Thermogutta terrifontis TaxID=1331910 RepID=A0A286REI8_9BACT|nr:hypothetical protein THTE_1760 [Thermogutta terrifontis]
MLKSLGLFLQLFAHQGQPARRMRRLLLIVTLLPGAIPTRGVSLLTMLNPLATQ